MAAVIYHDEDICFSGMLHSYKTTSLSFCVSLTFLKLIREGCRKKIDTDYQSVYACAKREYFMLVWNMGQQFIHGFL